LKNAGVKLEIKASTNYQTSKLPVMMDYIDEIDIAEAKEIPTYKRMCICIMKNDHLCKYMGFTLTKNEMARRKNIMAKYQNLL
jgi:predicted phosphoadenosine phosphosulfate sulfurtransferase